MDKIRTVCFTGHRNIENSIAFKIPSALKQTLEELISRGARSFKAGGAVGFDTICALCVLELRESHPDITLDLILPCRDQTRGWDEGSIRAYKYILDHADSVRYISDVYRTGCMHDRNRALVEGSDVCVAFLMRSDGGSAFTYALALRSGIEVINIFDIL